MAMNPMQRKANNYLLIGVLVTLLITGSIIAFLFLQLNKLNTQIKAEQAAEKTVYTLTTDVKSGANIQATDLKSVKVNSAAAPTNALNLGNVTEATFAKIDLKAGTIVTEDMVYEEGEEPTKDIRTQEYNMISLPSQIQEGDYIDIRLKLPNGTDFIVVSKKRVSIPTIDGIESATTIRINVSEDEILLMGNAIVEAYCAKGSILYATTYVEAGIQEQATPTYLPTDEVIRLINSDPNVINVAKTELVNRYNSNAEQVRSYINGALSAYAEDRQDNIETGMQEEITRAREERQAYLESLGGY